MHMTSPPITLLTIDTPTVADFRGASRPVVACFNRKIRRGGVPYLIEATVYEVRKAGDYPKTVQSFTASASQGKLLHYDQWCEYQLAAQNADGEPVGEVYDSMEQDNGVDSQRSDMDGAIQYAYSSISEIESGELNLMFGE